MSTGPSHVWYTRCPAPTPLSIAYQLGWIDEAFARFGIEVRSIRDSKDPAVRQSHFTHALDYSFRQGGNIPPIWTRSKGRETRIVGITTTDEFQAIIALPGSEIDNARDLRGRRLGLPKNAGDIIDFQRATSLKGIVSALRLEGLEAKDVELVDIVAPEASLVGGDKSRFLGLPRRYPYGAETLALARGEIDAFFVKGAEGLVLANQIGARVVSEFGFHPDPTIRINNGTPRPLTVDAKFLADYPDLVALLVSSVARVDAWARSKPDDAVRLIANEIGVSESAIWAANGPEVHTHLTLGLDADQVRAFDHFQAFLLEWGFIPAPVDAAAWISEEPLHAQVGEAAQ